MISITQVNDSKKGYFLAEDGGIEAGRLVYNWAGETKFIIEHTEVNPDFRGQNVGKLLVQEAVKFARDNHAKIMPLCPFANALFKKTPEWEDVLF